MGWRKKYLIFILVLFINIIFSLSAFAINDFDVIFNAPGSQLVNITINYSQITIFSYNITGSSYNSSYPSNISVDIGNDGFVDWEYKVYHSNISAVGNTALNVWSTNPDSGRVDVVSNMSDISGSGFSLGYIKNNVFQKTSNVINGNLSLSSVESDINQQIISFTTNTSTIHAFVPAFASVSYMGVYIAEGGSTYYCNSDHSFDFVLECNLSLSDAFTATHLARQATDTNFTITEPVNNPNTITTINNQLSSCSLPCNITINISSASPGNITLSGFNVFGTSSPPNISVTENSTHYNVNISSGYSLTSVKYSYGDIPQVFFIPAVADDDTRNLTTNESLRINLLRNNLKNKWDNLTDRKHPMNFTFFTTPMVISDYLMSENSSFNFTLKARSAALSQISGASPIILAIIDAHDYFPTESPSNSRTALNSNGFISDIYLNGFSDNNSRTNLFNYDNSTLLNIALHELLHTFIFYPSSGNLFDGDHPSSFSNLTDFTTNDINDSPTANEGYYDIYSPLNQIRPYIADIDINNNSLQLSILDKMLLGVRSHYDNGSFTFYSGNITRSNNRYSATTFTSAINQSARDLYDISTDSSWWDIRTDSTKTDMGTTSVFSIAKTNQKNKSLWVYASDGAYTDYFKVFNANSGSTDQVQALSPSIFLDSPLTSATISSVSYTFKCSAEHNIQNISFYSDISGNWSLEYVNSTGSSISYTYDFSNISNSAYSWNCLAYSNSSELAWSKTNYVFTNRPFTLSPDITYSDFGGSTTNFDSLNVSQAVNFSNAIIENTSYGKISFLGSADFTGSNLNSYVFIENNNIGIDTTNLPNLNILANITFYNVPYNNPSIWRDGAVCSAPVCNLLFNNGSQIIINVTSFSNYTLGSLQPTLNTPANNSISSNTTSIFNCSVTSAFELRNISLYHNISGSWQLNQTTNITGMNDSSAWIINNISDGNYIWNCFAYDNNSQSDWGNSNYTFTIDLIAPVISNIINYSITNESAGINWTTNELSNSSVNYGNTTSLGIFVSNTTLTLVHFTNLIGLSRNTTYYYNATSCDSSGNCNTNGTYSFTTLSEMPIIFILNWSEWNISETINFSKYSTAQLSNMSNVNFSNSFGKISFLQSLNLTQNRNLLQRIMVMRHRIWINSSLIPEFNKSARLTFRNVNLTLPVIKRDGVDCSFIFCLNTSYNSTTKVFELNVTSFSEYSLEEQCSDGIQNYDETGVDCGGSCSACSSTSSSGGGGGGSSSDVIEIILTEAKTVHTVVRNDVLSFSTADGTTHTLTITKISSDIGDFFLQSDPVQFSLSIGEEKTYDLNDNEQFYIKLISIMDRKADIVLKKIAKILPIITLPSRETVQEEIGSTSEQLQQAEDSLAEKENDSVTSIATNLTRTNNINWPIRSVSVIIPLIFLIVIIHYHKHKDL